MRDLLSRRFWAALGGVISLVLVVALVGAAASPTAPVVTQQEPERRIDSAGLVTSAELSPGWSVRGGLTEGSARFGLGDGRSVNVGEGTPGVVTCPRPDRPGTCALLMDELGGAAVWFLLAPVEGESDVVLPGPVAVLDQGREARLANGWVVPLVDVVTRRCATTETSSFRDFVARIGAESVAVYDLNVNEVSTVACLSR